MKVQGVSAATYPAAGTTNFLGGAAVVAGSNLIPVVSWNGTDATETNVTVFMPASNPQQFQYDKNGNVLFDGLRFYTWDEENRLTSVEAVTNVPGVERFRSEYLYDAQWRRIARTEYSAWNGTAYATTNSAQFIWDNWLLLSEITTGNEQPSTNNYTWGLDLSGSLQGAGGIGGLLAAVSSAPAPCSLLYAFDGNGNVTHVVDAQGSVVAAYDYDPFGRTLSATGSYAESNRWRFSTKQFEETSGLGYWGYRYYDPQIGRWLTRDPIGERPNTCVYAYVSNEPMRRTDPIGLTDDGTVSCGCLGGGSCTWSGSISGQLVALLIGGFASANVSASGFSADYPQCMWSVSGAGYRYGPGSGAGLGVGQLTVNLSFSDVVAPCEWPVAAEDLLTATVIGATAGFPVGLAWAQASVGSFTTSALGGGGGFGAFVGGGAFQVDVDFSRTKWQQAP